jgi:uncharacterized flavoprotein (TIGR03862 family)
VAVIGGGPAGLMAAQVLAEGGCAVDVYDAMPSVGRKFLLAGKGGLNLTHAEAHESFLSRFGSARARLQPVIDEFGPEEQRGWARQLGVETFVGTSGRVFPADMKAAPLLRAWLHRLRQAGVTFHMRHRWLGWRGAAHESEPSLVFATPAGEVEQRPAVTVLALGGGSWPRLGSDGAWVGVLESQGVAVAPLRSANCGFDVAWSEMFRTRHAGQPVKSVTVDVVDGSGGRTRRKGELVITAGGIEGGVIYALSAPLRDAIQRHGDALLHIDLAPDRTSERLTNELARSRGSGSWSRHLERSTGLRGVKLGLLREVLAPQRLNDVDALVTAIKALPIRLVGVRPVAEAISTAGGVAFEAVDQRLMLKALPGVFCAGEMLDWEAPTGGYLLTACLATGRWAGFGALDWIENSHL